MRTISALAYTQGRDVPSARFRVQQYLPQLAAGGVSLRERPARFGSYPPGPGAQRLPWFIATLAERALAAAAGNRADVVLFQREMVSTFDWPEHLCRAPAVLDVDDAIWLTQRRGMVDRLAALCRMVLCGNDYIAAHFAPVAPVRVLPTGVDTTRWVPGERSARPTLVWSGSAGGLPYLYAIEAPLARLLAAVPDARLRVVCNAAPKWARLDPARVEFVPWSPASEVAAVQSAWVGLMPMPDTPWTRGKCSFKMLTYLACGVPAVASPYGMNAQVIADGGAFGAESDDDWIGQLLALLGNDGAAREAGRVGRQQIERQYSAALIGTQLAQSLREAAT